MELYKVAKDHRTDFLLKEEEGSSGPTIQEEFPIEKGNFYLKLESRKNGLVMLYDMKNDVVGYYEKRFAKITMTRVS